MKPSINLQAIGWGLSPHSIASQKLITDSFYYFPEVLNFDKTYSVSGASSLGKNSALIQVSIASVLDISGMLLCKPKVHSA